jgi:hypothetical protein
MTIAIVALALLLAGTVPAAIAYAAKYGRTRGDLTVSRDERRRAINAAGASETDANERIRRKDLVISGLKAKLRGLRDDLKTHPDPIVRGSVALDSIVGLLQELQAGDDSEPDSPNEAGAVLTGDGS